MKDIKFSEILKKYKIDYGLTVQELADFLGVSKRITEEWLAGRTVPRTFTLNAVREKLNKS